jgi:hypothetical protein
MASMVLGGEDCESYYPTWPQLLKGQALLWIRRRLVLLRGRSARIAELEARFADIAWRLHPESAVEDFQTRALSEKVEAKERNRCLTAIAFMKSEKAALTMLDLSREAPQETRVMASWWLFHPEQSIWRTYAEIAKVIKPKPVTQDYLIPKTLGTVTKGLAK